MGQIRKYRKTKLLLCLVILAICLLWLPKFLQHTASVASTPHKVHITFGFHVNLYHSFRGDTNDENGFGQDIRVIRHILRQLDKFNRQGVPVRAAWDFDNLFSLQEILPLHAPDIIRDIQRRVRSNRDEVILMSYNNGLASAMDPVEFSTSLKRAITNSNGSGVQDLFGRYTPVVRPQEMMTTPGNFELYKALGIHHAALYYSATSFDAFRLFSRQLTYTEAYNPINYHHPESGEEMVILPTYHVGDLVEHVSLRNWAEKLHRLQNEGEIERDVLIFLNFDADAEFWTGSDLSWHLKWLPNTGGLGQLVESVADLDFVNFTTLGDYLSDHPPTGSIHFSQDTADGSFNGYHSWAEKAYVSDYWTRIEANRRAHQIAEKLGGFTGEDSLTVSLRSLLERSFETRLRALSTTNFGLAGPFLTRQRESAMADLLNRLEGYTEAIEHHCKSVSDAFIAQAPLPLESSRHGRLVSRFLHLSREAPGLPAGDRHLVLALESEISQESHYFLTDGHSKNIPFTLVNHSLPSDTCSGSITLRISREISLPEGIYFLFQYTHPQTVQIPSEPRVYADRRILKNEHIAVHFDEHGHISSLKLKGVQQLEAGSLIPHIRYGEQRLSPKHLNVTVEESGASGSASVRIYGPWQGPAGVTRSSGWVEYRLRLVDDTPYLFIKGRVRYPDTFRHDVVSAEKPMLARKIDSGWQEVAPLELRFSPRATQERPFLVQKRNFLGRESAYALDYFRHSPENLNLDSINNHITAEYAGVTNGMHGLAMAMNTAVRANFAFCPLKLVYHSPGDQFQIHANPFGTYHGDQIVPPTRGNRLGFEAVVLSAPQFTSAAPTYNGYTEHFDLMLAFFNGNAIPETVKRDLVSFARQPLILGPPVIDSPEVPQPPIQPPAGFMALPYWDGILFHWESVATADTKYRIRWRSLQRDDEKAVTIRGNTWFQSVDRFDSRLETVASMDGAYAATIQALLSDGRRSPISEEIRFRPGQSMDHDFNIPNHFKAKIVWANVRAWIHNYLL